MADEAVGSLCSRRSILPRPQFKKSAVKIELRLAIIALVSALVFSSCSRDPATSSSSATPSEVPFLDLPSDATTVRYWNHWHNRVAVFETSEEDFRAIFPSIHFVEITDSKFYYVGGFGDTSKPPWKQNMRAESSAGLFYQEIADNGGGETILYDRVTGTGYYEYTAW